MTRLAACLLLLASDALAVPAFQQLYQRRFGVAVASCAVCHAGGAGGKLNDFGRDFLKGGATWDALGVLAGRDADGDGAATADEIKAGSNPGDPASTPKRPGAWLASVKLEDRMPLDELAEMFPAFKRFEFQDAELSDADADAVARSLGAPLAREDRFVTLYFPVDAKAVPPARAGVAVFSAASLEDGVLLTGLALDPSGRIVKAWGNLYSPTGRDSLKELARQLPGRMLDAPLVLGKDLKPLKGRKRLSEQGRTAFKKALLIVARRLAAKG